MTKTVQTERRWLRAVIAASAEPLPNFPWMRGDTRRRPAALAAADTAPLPAAPLPRVALFSRPGSIAAH